MLRRASAVVLGATSSLLCAASCEVELEVLASAPGIEDAGGELEASLDADAAPDATESGACGETGERCAAAAECCSGMCAIDPTAQVTCRPATGCLPLGEACTFAGACCTLACDGSCTLGECASIGESCQTDADCCSNDCQSGTCAGQSLACLPAGESCASGEDCCSKLCVDEGTGLRCALRAACRVEGEVCAADADCCSGACGETKPGFGYCIPLGACTMGDGKSCSRQVGELCKDDAQCCSRVCLGSPLGKRCAASGGCRAQCEICTNDGDCCSGSCVPDAAGVPRCAPADGCLPSGEVCETDAQCCVDQGKARCSDDPTGPTGARRCHAEDPPPPCLAGEAACALGSACCSALCLPASGGYTCQLECAPDGKPCTIRSDCCGLLSDCLSIGGQRVCAPV